jgi:hypothetical protein
MCHWSISLLNWAAMENRFKRRRQPLWSAGGGSALSFGNGQITAANFSVAPVAGGDKSSESFDMNDVTDLLARLYDRFNARDIDAVLAALDENIIWANGMEGGHFCGREAVRRYWTHQWSLVDPHVEPLSFTPQTDRFHHCGGSPSRFRKSVARFSDRNLRQNKRLSRRSVGEATQVCLDRA